MENETLQENNIKNEQSTEMKFIKRITTNLLCKSKLKLLLHCLLQD